MKGYSHKGRTARAALTEPDVRRIRQLHTYQGVSVRQLADTYEVALETIRRILRWETWRWVGEEGEGAIPKDFMGLPLEQASVEKLKAKLAEEPSGSGIEKLQQEATKALRTDILLKELKEGK